MVFMWKSLTLALALGLAALAQTDNPSTSPMGPGMMGQCAGMNGMAGRFTSPPDRALMAAMMSMHTSMASMHPTGNADSDFMTMMIPHHQSAIDMANVELRYGKDPKVMNLARQIIASQSKEIAQMQGWLRR